MAVSNTIGSNVFDILVGLGIPWGLQTMVINYGSTVSASLPGTCIQRVVAWAHPTCLCHLLWLHGTQPPPWSSQGCLQGELLLAELIRALSSCISPQHTLGPSHIHNPQS